MRGRFRRATEETISTSFLDLLSNGVGAAIVLLLIFAIARGAVAHTEPAGAELIRARFAVRDLTHDWLIGARPIVAVIIESAGRRMAFAIEFADDGDHIKDRAWSRTTTGLLADTPIEVGGYPSSRDIKVRDYDVVVENPGEACWSFSVRFIDRERSLGYDGDERGIEVNWIREGRGDGEATLMPNQVSAPYGLQLAKGTAIPTMERCSR